MPTASAPIAYAHLRTRRNGRASRGISPLEVKTVVPDEVAPPLEFGEFFRAEYPGLVRAFYVLTANQSEAEELAQEAMARAYERWERVGAMESLAGYLYRIGVNVNRHRLRHLGVRARRFLAMTRDAQSEEVPSCFTIARAAAGRGCSSLPFDFSGARMSNPA